MIDEKAQSIIKRELADAKKASLVVGVVSGNDKMITGTTHEETGARQDGDHVFEMGSTTKTFTSLLLSKLVLSNRVALDEAVSSYKPEYRNALTSNGKEVTFRHLATHRSGLPREDMKKLRKRLKEHKDEKDNPYKYFSHQDFNQFFIDHDLKQEIGKKWKYSNIGVGLLGNLLAEMLGMSYEEAIQTEILSPLGMEDTFITGNEQHHARYIHAYNKKGERIPPILLPAIEGAGALRSTVGDMLLYLQHQMGMTENPLRKEMELTHKVHGETGKKGFDMGLGWFIEQKKWSEHPIIHHGGTTMGFHTYCGFIKEKQIGIVISSTIQLKNLRLIKMLLNLTGAVNEDIAEAIFKHHLSRG